MNVLSQGAQSGTLKFMYDGQRIAENLTPKLMEMEDGDTIDVFAEQVGGR